jgi:hypothetical protein
MSEDSVKNYYMGSFIGSLIGGIMILLFDFAAWDSSNYYLRVYSEGWFGTDSIGGILFLVPIGIGLLYVAYNSYQGTKAPLSVELLERVYKVSLAAIIAIFVIAAIVAITLTGEEVEWWFDAGFYGGAIGSLISTLFLRNAKSAM